MASARWVATHLNLETTIDVQASFSTLDRTTVGPSFPADQNIL